ncbi:hypothetical protein D3C75_583950 [compost metagenome]
MHDCSPCGHSQPKVVVLPCRETLVEQAGITVSVRSSEDLIANVVFNFQRTKINAREWLMHLPYFTILPSRCHLREDNNVRKPSALFGLVAVNQLLDMTWKNIVVIIQPRCEHSSAVAKRYIPARTCPRICILEKDPDPCVLLREVFKIRTRTVAGTIVDNKDFKVIVRLRADRVNSPLKHLKPVERRYVNGN